METETNASRAYQHLRSKLLSGEVQPGQRLLYGPIGKEIGVSATPVREAAQQLANEGLVELVPQLGAVVRKLDRTELIEIYEVRLAIEPYAARLAADRVTPTQLKQLSASLARMKQLAVRQSQSPGKVAGKRTSSQFDKADFAFHMQMIQGSGNRAMVHTAGRSHVLTRVFGVRRHHYTGASMHATCDDHLAILAAVQHGRGSAAYDAAAAHIQNGLTISLAAIDAAENSAETASSETASTDATGNAARAD